MLATIATLLVVTDAAAGDSPRLLLVPDDGPLVARKIAAEAVSAGFEVIERPRSALDQGGDAPDVGAIAMVRPLSERRVQIGVGRGGGREFSVHDEPQDEPASFPLLLVEEIRTRLVELHLWLPAPAVPQVASAPPEPPAPSSLPVAPPAMAPVGRGAPPIDLVEPSREPKPEPRTWLWLGAGPAVIVPAGGLGPTVHGLVGAGVDHDDRWRAGALAFLPLHDTMVRAPEGDADIGSTILAATVAYAPWRSAEWGAFAGLGAGPLFLAMRADAPAPYIGREATAVAGVYFFDATLERRIADWFRFQATAIVGASAPRPVVRFDDRDVVAWGRTFGAVALRAEVGLSPGAGGTPR